MIRVFSSWDPEKISQLETKGGEKVMDDSNATARLEMAKMTLDGLRTCETSLCQQFGGERFIKVIWN